jgi:hypothetical protein
MTLEDTYFVSQIIAAVAIVGSLIFVGVQLRQAERTQRAAMHQGRTQRGMDMALRSAEPHIVAALDHIVRQDPAATADHFVKMNSLLRAMILNLDDVVWQQKAGLLDKETLENTLAPMRFLFAFASVRAVWQMARATYSKDTAALVDKLVIGDVPPVAPGDPIVIWRAISAQMMPAGATS